ncbi:hypothetical protein RchiOBHm_Chr3g0469131 [Rosa chinensis]|uniref:Uncharacterized protein n=1 Tax=Rosa chinensis TaxID=74649 RepID=A0A2P6RAP7_ROSCH|nr:hypothetical protein RchiOBHm_Chr3g0469131 [Rosa chinensis]
MGLRIFQTCRGMKGSIYNSVSSLYQHILQDWGPKGNWKKKLLLLPPRLGLFPSP